MTLHSVEEEIIDFLSANPYRAYTSTEIWFELGYHANMNTLRKIETNPGMIVAFQHSLIDLVNKRGVIRANDVKTKIGTRTFYMW